jgi:hypothetical protein
MKYESYYKYSNYIYIYVCVEGKQYIEVLCYVNYTTLHKYITFLVVDFCGPRSARMISLPTSYICPQNRRTDQSISRMLTHGIISEYI